MAEAATVVQLIQFSGVVLSSCYQYISKARGANQEIEQILTDVGGLEGILKRLHELTADGDAARHTLLASLGGPDGTFQACLKALEELQKRLVALTDAPSAKRKLLWPLEAGKIADILRRLGEHKHTFILALLGDQAISSTAEEKRTTKIAETVKTMREKKDFDDVMDWLGGVDPSTNYNAARSRQERGTGDWLLQSDEFQTWKSSNGHVFWLVGIPGAGKTILTSTVIDHLISKSNPGNQCRVAYYFFDFNDTGKQTIAGFLRSVVRQLCMQADEVSEELKALYHSCKRSMPTTTQLLGILSQFAASSSPSYIVIDALDECPESEINRERKMFLNMLSEVKHSASASFNFFISSRPESDIKNSMASLADYQVDVKGSQVADDIRSHVVAFIEHDARMKGWPQVVKNEVIECLSEKSDGMFRWAVCQLEALRTCLKPKLATIKQKLSDLPRTLDDTYERIFQNMNPDYEREIHIILMLLTSSVRPMTIQEVAEATCVNLEQQVFDLDDRFADPYDLLELCSSLVSLVEIGSGNGSTLYRERNGMVQWGSKVKLLQLAHFSVKEFLVAERTKSMIPPALRVDKQMSQQRIAELCLIYILDFNEGMRADDIDLEKFPMLTYATLHWHKHATVVSHGNDGRIQGLLLRLFDPHESGPLINFLNLYDPATILGQLHLIQDTVRSSGPARRSKQAFETPLYYASYYGLYDIAKWLAGLEERNGSSKERLGSALGAAAAQGHLGIATMLLEEYGADPNSPFCKQIYRPLFAAAGGANTKLVELLLHAGADASIIGGEDGTALHRAAKHGNAEVIQLLIDAGNPIDVSARSCGTALALAARRGNDEAVRVLIRNGANVNPFATSHNMPLVCAAAKCTTETVKLLLDCGAEVNVSSELESALYSAAANGRLSTMRLLVAHGAHIDGATSMERTPLEGSIMSRDPACFEFMLENGADIHTKGRSTRCIVDQALHERNLYAAQKLLQLGAKPGTNAIWGALSFASQRHLIPDLLSHGADPNSECYTHGNVLQLAALCRAEEATKSLLAAGANVNAIEGQFGTALQAAAQRGNIEICRLLLQYGATVNQPICGVYGTALHAATYVRNEKIFNFLVDSGARIDAVSEKQGTVLYAAAENPNYTVDLVRKLLDRGAKPNNVSGIHGTALKVALSRGNLPVAKLLLQHGANPRLKIHQSTEKHSFEERTCSSLIAAVSSGDIEIVRLLLEYAPDLIEVENNIPLLLWFAARTADTAMLDFFIGKELDMSQGAWGLQAAIIYNRTPNLHILLKYHPKTDRIPYRWKPAEGVTGSALILSIQRKRWDIMDSLLEAGEDVNAISNGTHQTALNIAVDIGQKDIVMKLLDRGADVNIQPPGSSNAAAWATKKGDEDLLRLLVERGARVNANLHYESPLQIALHKGYYDIARWLLDNGADPMIPGHNINALVSAAGQPKPGQLEFVRRLIAMECDLNAFDVRPYKGSPYRDRVLLNPLSAAVRENNFGVVNLLLDSGADVNAVGGTFGTALQVAACFQATSLLKLLLARGADVNVVGGNNGTALQAAIVAGSDEDVKVLLDAGADVNTEGGYYGTALQAASRVGSFRWVKVLIERGAEVNTHNGRFDCPLQAAAKSGNLEIMQLLVQHGADVNSEGGKYWTPLQAACCDSSESKRYWSFRTNVRQDLIEYLIANGAKLDTAGGKYHTALQAAAFHHRSFVEALLKHGADANIEGGKFGTPIQAARRKGLHRVVKLLEDYGVKDDWIQDPLTEWVYGMPVKKGVTTGVLPPRPAAQSQSQS